MLKNYLFSPLCSAPFLCSSPLFLSASTPLSSFFSSGQRLSFALAFFFFSVSALSFLLQCPSLFSSPHFFLFFWLPFIFQPKILFFSPNVFQFFSPNVFQFFNPNVFASVQPLFSSSFFCFILFLFNPLFSLSAPPFFLFFSSVYPRPNILSSCFTSLLFE